MAYYKVTYKTSTELDPPAIRSIFTNFTSFADITKIQLAWEDINGLDITGWLFSFEVDGFIEVVNADDPSEYGIYKIIVMTNNTDSPTNPYIELDVAPTQINGVEYIPSTNNLVISHWNTAGADGTSGTSGTSGIAGADGTQGEPGPAGADGTQGVQGEPGSDGTDGTSGTSGIDGAQGANGVAGVIGVDGVAGNDGTSGTSGISPLEGVNIDAIIANLEAIVEELKKS